MSKHTFSNNQGLDKVCQEIHERFEVIERVVLKNLTDKVKNKFEAYTIFFPDKDGESTIHDISERIQLHAFKLGYSWGGFRNQNTLVLSDICKGIFLYSDGQICGITDHVLSGNPLSSPEDTFHVIYWQDFLKIPVKGHDEVNYPKHYTSHHTGIECIELTECMNFNTGNAFKYLWRAGLKNDIETDIKKARFYLERELARGKKKNEPVENINWVLSKHGLFLGSFTMRPKEDKSEFASIVNQCAWYILCYAQYNDEISALQNAVRSLDDFIKRTYPNA